MRDPGEEIAVDLTTDERLVLIHGLIEWSGPASCTDALAVAMGFDSVDDFLAESDRLVAALEANRPLTRWDWTRTLLATEIAFASDVVGSGAEWFITTGLDDSRTLEVLRLLQHKLVSVTVRIGLRPRP